MKVFNYYSKFQIFSIASFFILGNIFATDNASEQNKNANPMGFYFGGFGGWGFIKPRVDQKGTAFIFENSGGALAVNATGKTTTSHFGFGGLHIGFEWIGKNEKSWQFVPAIEFEGYYLASTLKADIENPTTRLNFHEFTDFFPTRTGIFIADAILALNNKYIIPYISAGVGAAIISIHDADCLQTDPPEVGINHFNSDPKGYDSSFATQVKAGLRYPVFNYMRLFFEYRYLYIFPVHFVFGSTDYPTHVVTSPWNVRLRNLQYNLFSLGIDFTF